MLCYFGSQRAAANWSLISPLLDHNSAERETGPKPFAPKAPPLQTEETYTTGRVLSDVSRGWALLQGQSKRAAFSPLSPEARLGSYFAPACSPVISASPLLILSRAWAERKRAFKYFRTRSNTGSAWVRRAGGRLLLKSQSFSTALTV